MATIYSMSTREINGVDDRDKVGDDDQRAQHDADLGASEVCVATVG